jgi:hypothetical protein
LFGENFGRQFLAKVDDETQVNWKMASRAENPTDLLYPADL